MKIILTLVAIFGLVHNFIRFDYLHKSIESDLDFILVIFGPFVLLVIAFFTKDSTYSEEYLFIKPYLNIIIFAGVVLGFIALISTYPSYKQPAQLNPSISGSKTFYDYDCVGDCSGHEAGYDWARQNDINYSSDCGGNSQSFTEGCDAWVKNSPDPIWDVRE